MEAIESALLQVEQGLLYALRRRARRFSRAGLFGRFGDRQAKEHVESASRFERQDARGDGVDGVPADFAAAAGAKGAARSGIEQAQIIINFGGSRYGGSRIARGVLLPDSDGRGDARNFVHIGLFDELEELTGVSGERINIVRLGGHVARVSSETAIGHGVAAG